MHDRAKRIGTVLLDSIQRAVKIARLRGSKLREAQPVESFTQDPEVPPALLTTHFDCRLEMPVAHPERADGTEARRKAPPRAFETIRLWGELDAQGELLVQGIEFEFPSDSTGERHG